MLGLCVEEHAEAGFFVPRAQHSGTQHTRWCSANSRCIHMLQADTSAQARASAAGAECLPGSLARYHRRAAGARLLSLRDLASSSSADATAPESDLSHSNEDGSRPIRACQEMTLPRWSTPGRAKLTDRCEQQVKGVGVSQTRKLLSSASGSTRHRQGQGDCNGKARYRAAQHGRGAGRSRADATGRGSDAPMAGGRRLWRR